IYVYFIYSFFFFFFFQAEDGIRDLIVTGVQTCALTICRRWARDGRDGRSPASRPTPRWCRAAPAAARLPHAGARANRDRRAGAEIGRASCRERGESSGGEEVEKGKERRGRGGR